MKGKHEEGWDLPSKSATNHQNKQFLVINKNSQSARSK
jgi:hypothetical protein